MSLIFTLILVVVIILCFHQGMAQEKCNRVAVQNILQIWTSDVTGECTPQTLNKLINFSENLQNWTAEAGKTKRICKEILEIETRKVIVDKIAEMLREAVDRQQSLFIVETLLQRIGQRDGLLRSSIDTVYWSLDASARHQLGNMLLMLENSEDKVNALLEFEQLAVATKGSQFESVRNYLSTLNESAIPDSSEVIKQKLKARNQHAKCQDSLNHCINAPPQRSYPPPELNTTLQAVTALRHNCQSLHLDRNFEKLEQDMAHTWRHCTIKLKNVINMKSINLSGYLTQLKVSLELMDEACTHSDETQPVVAQIRKFEAALHNMKYLC